MTDFNNIGCTINFVDGVFINIWDTWSHRYLVEVYENYGNDWALVNYNIMSPQNWFVHLGKKFRNEWRVKIWGWENNYPVLVTQHTFNEADKEVALTFDTDSYKESCTWSEQSIDYRDKVRTNLTVYSKFSDRLSQQYVDSKITFLPLTNIDRLDTKYYSRFKIGRFNIKRESLGEWGSGFLFCSNHTKPNVSSEHKNNWLPFNSKELFNDIMNL
jgi:hypothetical protein